MRATSSRVFVSKLIVGLCAGAIMSLPGARPGESAKPKNLSVNEVRRRARMLSPLLSREIASLRYLLRPEELSDLLSDPRDERCERWIDAYWDAHDPDFTTVENEARTEHERRVAVAESQFLCIQWPGWDDRGEVYIRYGDPASIYRQNADVIEPGILMPATEDWYYPEFNMSAIFSDPAGSGRFTSYLEDVRLPPGERPRNDRRVTASKYLADLHLDYLPVDMTHLDFRALMPPFIERDYDDYMDTVFRYQAVLEKTPYSYPSDHDWMRVPMAYRVENFRGGESVDRVDVNAEFQSRVAPLGDKSHSRRFTTTTVFWDLAWNEVVRFTRVDSVVTLPFAQDSMCTVVNQTTNTLRPGVYHMAITVREAVTGRFTSFRREVTCPSLEGKIAMSDLSMARRIGPWRTDSAFNRGPLEVVPRPSANYALANSMPVYFEVYNIEPDRAGRHRYTVEYSITPKTARPRSFWKQLTRVHEESPRVRSSFQVSADGSQDVVHISVGTQALWPGEFLIEVSVVDDETNFSASREATFYLVE